MPHWKDRQCSAWFRRFCISTYISFFSRGVTGICSPWPHIQLQEKTTQKNHVSSDLGLGTSQLAQPGNSCSPINAHSLGHQGIVHSFSSFSCSTFAKAARKQVTSAYGKLKTVRIHDRKIMNQSIYLIINHKNGLLPRQAHVSSYFDLFHVLSHPSRHVAAGLPLFVSESMGASPSWIGSMLGRVYPSVHHHCDMRLLVKYQFFSGFCGSTVNWLLIQTKTNTYHNIHHFLLGWLSGFHV